MAVSSQSLVKVQAISSKHLKQIQFCGYDGVLYRELTTGIEAEHIRIRYWVDGKAAGYDAYRRLWLIEGPDKDEWRLMIPVERGPLLELTKNLTQLFVS